MKKKAAKRKAVGAGNRPAPIKKALSKGTGKAAGLGHADRHLQRVRRLCHALPGTTEKLSRGEPTFFVAKKVYCMFANNHHNDGHVAVWIPAEAGAQEALIRSDVTKYFRPPYVGVKGWVGIELAQVNDDELGLYLLEAYRLIEPKRRVQPSRSVTSRLNKIYSRQQSTLDADLNRAQMKLEKEKW
jgi:hypothetical protein